MYSGMTKKKKKQKFTPDVTISGQNVRMLITSEDKNEVLKRRCSLVLNSGILLSQVAP
jgi:hypothetical protein